MIEEPGREDLEPAPEAFVIGVDDDLLIAHPALGHFGGAQLLGAG